MARGDFPSTKQDQYVLRFPDGMREQIKDAAEFSGRSMNAEIIQRLKFTFDESQAEKLHLHLPADLWNDLMADAGVHGVQMDDRVIEILQGTYNGDQVGKAALDEVRALVNQNSELSDQIAEMKEKADADFLLYYSKVVQLRQLAQSVLAVGERVPAEVSSVARDLDELSRAEIQTLAKRHDDAMFLKKLEARRNQLQQEIEESSGDRPD